MASTYSLPRTGPVNNPRIPHPLATDWFAPDVLPVRTGLYQVQVPDSEYAAASDPEVRWCWFDAQAMAWGWAYTAKRDALAQQWRDPSGATQRRTWRGMPEAALSLLS